MNLKQIITGTLCAAALTMTGCSKGDILKKYCEKDLTQFKKKLKETGQIGKEFEKEFNLRHKPGDWCLPGNSYSDREILLNMYRRLIKHECTTYLKKAKKSAQKNNDYEMQNILNDIRCRRYIKSDINLLKNYLREN